MRYKVWRGDREIGGMCIEVAAEDGTRVLLDLGMPLVGDDGVDFPRDTPQRPTEQLITEGVLRDIPGLFPHDASAPTVAAIVLTHAHLDHYGLAHHAHPGIPVYGSAGTIAVLDAGRVFFPDAVLPADLRVMPNDEPLSIGGLAVTAIPVDHAAPDSRAVLVEADGQRLMYTGDLRAHGRTGFRFDRILADPRLQALDWMLVEGTTLGADAGSHGMRSESQVEEELVRLACSQAGKLVGVVASGQNIDRLVSCYRAARRAGRLLVIDPYQAYILQRLTSLSASIPQFTWDPVRVSFAPHQVRRMLDAGLDDLVREMGRRARVSSDELAAAPGQHLLCCRGSYGPTKLLDKVGSSNVELVWSMWRGYWDRPNCAMREWSERAGVQARFIHSGGHAWPEDLRRLVDELRPARTVWVHTTAATKPSCWPS